MVGSAKVGPTQREVGTVFVQLIRGRTSDKEGLRRQLEAWMSTLRPDAKGYLGMTGGVTDDSEVFMAARFESEEAARANSDRPEQGAWWTETERYFDGPVSFVDSVDVDVQVEPSNDAGFVQVIQSKTRNRQRVEEINAQVGPAMTESRPEIIGVVSVWSGDQVCDIAYFTTEEAARAGEKKELLEAHRKLFEEWQSLIEDPTFLDIKDPWLY
jgi:hypothetical protein